MSRRRRRGKSFRILAAHTWRAAADASRPARRAAWRWTIRTLRDTLWRLDEWVHAQEVKIREDAECSD